MRIAVRQRRKTRDIDTCTIDDVARTEPGMMFTRYSN